MRTTLPSSFSITSRSRRMPFWPTLTPGYCFSAPTSISVRFQPNTRLIITRAINFALSGSVVAAKNKNESNKLRFSIDVEATEDLTNIGYRSRLTAVDGTSISVLLAPKLFSCKAGEKLTIPLEADVSQLVPGRYCLTPVLYGVNQYGGWQFYDHIEKAVTFEVETKSGFNENMEWEQRWWGSVKFPEIIDLRTTGE